MSIKKRERAAMRRARVPHSGVRPHPPRNRTPSLCSHSSLSCVTLLRLAPTPRPPRDTISRRPFVAAVWLARLWCLCGSWRCLSAAATSLTRLATQLSGAAPDSRGCELQDDHSNTVPTPSPR